ncbi:hypothetical protein G4B88_002342 (mitochondrion) [Cannabis sativa]|uniref:F-ATPase protein 6 n=1 Tax=Cannabis sativa TaxID=3483 RepID=A0A7J6DW55_CANSA|nr:hypothetical protein G4B88_002342 [Cannabis sativa]
MKRIFFLEDLTQNGVNSAAYTDALNLAVVPSPLEQFSILPLIPMNIGNLYFSFTNSALFMLLTLSLVLLLVYFVTKNGGGNLVPNAWQSLVELIYDFVLNLGMIPYSFTVTRDLGPLFIVLALTGLELGVAILQAYRGAFKRTEARISSFCFYTYALSGLKTTPEGSSRPYLLIPKSKQLATKRRASFSPSGKEEERRGLRPYAKANKALSLSRLCLCLNCSFKAKEEVSSDLKVSAVAAKKKAISAAKIRVGGFNTKGVNFTIKAIEVHH